MPLKTPIAKPRSQVGRSQPSQSCRSGQFREAPFTANPRGSCPLLPRSQGAPCSRASPGQGGRFLRRGSGAAGWSRANPTGSPLQVKVRTSWEQMGPALLVKEHFCYLC